MQRLRGFTIVEIIITIAIMGILLGLVMAGFRHTQAVARDDKLEQQAQAIARGLENLYRTGIPEYDIKPNHYPSVRETMHAIGWGMDDVGPHVPGGYLHSWLDGVPDSAMTRFELVRFIKDGKWTPIGDETNVRESTPVGKIRYEPYKYNKKDFYGDDRYSWCNLKNEECVGFNLYYHTEVDDAIHVIRSKRQ